MTPSPLKANILLKKLEQKMTFEEYVPFSYFFHWNDAMTDVTSITFDLHDRLNNQVLMFDLFINAVNLESLGIWKVFSRLPDRAEWSLFEIPDHRNGIHVLDRKNLLSRWWRLRNTHNIWQTLRLAWTWKCQWLEWNRFDCSKFCFLNIFCNNG